MEAAIKQIRNQLRRSMNGVTSDSMRKKGIHYKLNFGVSLPDIKKIASSHTPDQELAEFLWMQDVREMKILATMLYPEYLFTPEKAEEWIKDIRYIEIAEQLVINLLVKIPHVDDHATEWFIRENEFSRIIAFLLVSRLFAGGYEVSDSFTGTFLRQACLVIEKGGGGEQRAALQALKRYGRGDKERADRVLELLVPYEASDSPEKKEFYNDLKFEFDYYL